MSTTGDVLGMATMVTKPPAAAAALPVAMSSRSSRPGVRRWTWGSTNPGTATSPAASTSSRPRGRAADAALAHDQVAHLVDAGGRVEHAGAAQHEGGGRAGPLDQSRPHQTATAPIGSTGSAAAAGSARRS